MRSAAYVAKRIMRLTATPHAVAAGVAAGVFSSFTPYLGLHFLIAFAVAYVIAGNFLAAALGTFFGNPLTFPFIWAGTFATGKFILAGSHADAVGQQAHERVSELGSSEIFSLGLTGVFNKIAGLWEPVLKPMTIGAIPLGVVFGIIAYILTRRLAQAVNVRRRALAERRLRAGLDKDHEIGASRSEPVA